MRHVVARAVIAVGLLAVMSCSRQTSEMPLHSAHPAPPFCADVLTEADGTDASALACLDVAEADPPQLASAECRADEPSAATTLDNPELRTAKRQKSTRRDGAEHPDLAAEWRYRQRLNEDGTMTPQGLMRAKQQVDQMLAQEAAGGTRTAGITPPTWLWQGPGNQGGRIRAMVIHPTTPDIMYVGSASGGIWKTENGGAAWYPLNDFMANLAVTSLVMDPGNPDVLYAATGEGFSMPDAQQGAGVFKSTNAGATWTQLPATAGWLFTNRLTIHPTNGQILLAATDAGIQRTTNGGAAWTAVATANANTLDVRFDPTDGNRAVAGLRSRAVEMSTDAGQTWSLTTLYRQGGETLRNITSNSVADANADDDRLRISGGLGLVGTTGLIQIGNATNLEIAEVTHVTGNTLMVSDLANNHAIGEAVISLFGSTFTRAAFAADGDAAPDVVELRHLTGLIVNDRVRIGRGASAEIRFITAINAANRTITVADLANNHPGGAPVHREVAITTLTAAAAPDGDVLPNDILNIADKFGFNGDPNCFDFVQVGSGAAEEFAVLINTTGANQFTVTDLNNNHANGAPVRIAGRVELAYSLSHPNIVYASVENPSTRVSGNCTSDTLGLWISTDGGQSFIPRNIVDKWLASQGWYDNMIWVDPLDPNIIIVGGVELFRSTDAGATFTQLSDWNLFPGKSAHADQHLIVEHPQYRVDANHDNVPDNTIAYFCNDGGVYRAANARTVRCVTGNCPADWTELNNQLGITQFYSGAVSPNGTLLFGGSQDNGTQRRNASELPETWHLTQKGDGGQCAADLTSNTLLYGETFNAFVFRSTNGGQTATFIQGAAMGTSACNFIAPLEIDPNNRDRLLVGCSDLYLATDARTATPATWNSIKASLAPIAPATVAVPISAIAVRKPLASGAGGNSNIIWVGHNDGRIFRTTDGGTNWNAVANAPGDTPARFITDIEFDPHDADKVYVTFSGYAAGNVWSTSNNGTDWEDLQGDGSGGVLPELPVSTIAVHPGQPGWLYVGTDLGVFASADDGVTWSTANAGATALNDGPANVEVDELFFANDRRTLYAATYGRGMYKADVGTNSIDDPGVHCIARVSRRPDGGSPDNITNQPAVSSDGRFVAFTTAGSDLLPGTADSNGVDDVYVRDRHAGTNERISVNSLEAQGNQPADDPAISADGRFVAFVSKSANLPGTNGRRHVYLRDRLAGTTVLVSRRQTGTAGNGDSAAPSVSLDGRYIAFLSKATNLDDLNPGTATRHQVYVHDRITGETRMLSHDGFLGTPADRECFAPHISADARYVAFHSAASNLTSVPANGKTQVFVCDAAAETCVQFLPGTELSDVPDGDCTDATLSADGRYVAFASTAGNLTSENANTNGTRHIYVYDRDVNEDDTYDEVGLGSNGIAVVWVTASCDADETNADSEAPKISASGQYVVFASRAGNLLPVPINTNGAPAPISAVWHVFAHNRDTDFDGVFDEIGATTSVRLSVNVAGEVADEGNTAPDVSSNGSFVVWQTEANNLDPTDGDSNGLTDIYIRDRFPLWPCILGEPIDTIVCAGDPAKLLYHADYIGNPVLIPWYRDLTQTGDFGQVLYFPSAEASDADTYHAEIYDLDGVTQIGSSDDAQLMVINDTPLIVTPPSDISICNSLEASFTVSAQSSDPALRYRWRKNGIDIPGNHAAGPTLSFAEAQPSDAGTYSVRLTDRCGTETLSDDVELTYDRPYIITHPLHTDVCTDGVAVFKVVAGGAAPLSYKWKRDGLFMTDDVPRITGTQTDTLTINDVTAADIAVYSVQITNACGVALTAPVSLRVATVPPTITSEPENDNVCVGSSTEFSVQATNATTYEWSRNGQPVVSTNGTMATLSIGFVTYSHAGTYQVAVRNGCGEVMSTNAVLSVTDCDPICGDLDHDHDVDIDDFDIFVSAFASTNGAPEFVTDADFDIDDQITFVDYQSWLQCYRDYLQNPLAGPPLGLAGDYNGDDDVDLGDFAAYQRCVEFETAQAFPCLIRFDLNRDGSLTESDDVLFIGALEASAP